METILNKCMNQFDILVQEQLLMLDESWKDTAKKYATGAALGAAGILGLQHGAKDTQHNHELTRTKMVQQQNVGSQSSSASKANAENPIKSKHNINQFKTGFMGRFFHNGYGSTSVKSSKEPTYRYEIRKEIGDMYPNYQMVKIYNYDTPVVTIRFSKDGSQITNIIKKPNLYFPPEMQKFMNDAFGITL